MMFQVVSLTLYADHLVGWVNSWGGSTLHLQLGMLHLVEGGSGNLTHYLLLLYINEWRGGGSFFFYGHLRS
jgi:hypothetical protein